MFLWNKSSVVGHLKKGVKNVFNQVENHIWNRWCLGLALLLLYRNDPIDMLWGSFYVMT